MDAAGYGVVHVDEDAGHFIRFDQPHPQFSPPFFYKASV